MYTNSNSTNGQTSSNSEIILANSVKLSPEHQAQIEARGFTLPWAEANCMSCDIEKASVILNYPAKSAGIMLMSDDYGQWQFRPDVRWPSKDGKMPKYRTSRGEYDAFLAKHPTIKAFWSDLEALKARCFTIDDDPYLLITEGGFKSMKGCQHDIPTVGLVGVDMGLTPKSKGKPDLIPVLKRFAEAGFGFIFAFDADAVTNRNVRAAESKLAKVLMSYGCAVRTITGHWEEEDGKGMDDFIHNQGIEDFLAILEESKPYSIESRLTGGNDSPSPVKTAVLAAQVEEAWGKRLRLNEMTQQIEMDGKANNLDTERAYIRMAKELGLAIDKQKASDLVVMCAQQNTYSPVREYLNSVASVEPINLETLAERCFGTQNPLHAVLLKRTLIAAVARAFKPGCKVDTVCILQGEQGWFKSLFWQTLAGEDFFTDNLSEGNEKDEKLKLRRYWMLEFSEFETAYKRKEVSQLKAFISSRIDSLRPPYGRAIQDFPRTSIFVGSTNRQEFLHDVTGERRYWVIPVAHKIPITTVKAERDGIWAAALAAYKSGEQWWLTPEEDELLAEANKSFKASDTWEASILTYLQHKSATTVSDLLTKVIGLDLAQQKKAEQMRVSDILRCNGWVRSKKRIEGKPQWCWEKVVSEVGTPQNPLSTTVSTTFQDEVTTEVGTEVGTPSNSLFSTLSDVVFPPVPTFTQKDCLNQSTHPKNLYSNKKSSDGSIDSREVCEQGGNISPDNPQDSVEQRLQGVPTSVSRGGNTPSEPEKIADEDAQRLRDIALIWWSEYYPEQVQTLLTQMYGWQTPGRKYSAATITDWLEEEEQPVRDRLTELMRLREGRTTLNP
ncbi:VapE domain-containing protein [Microcoleus sp. B3-D7]|uniref:VapE domain-containing protein n=1 Tax=Microcoleus sp. B3-D7 TaxID=2818659 RepID=UPI002FD21FA8